MNRACRRRATQGCEAKLVELAWLWLRHQPGSALSRWFHGRVRHGGRLRRRRSWRWRRLLVAPWKYAAAGIVIEGAVMKPA